MKKVIEYISLSPAIELFTLLSACSFVLSGIANFSLFWFAWDINYFQVAAPSDIVMSSFMYGVILFATLIFIVTISPFLYAVWTMFRRIIHPLNRPPPQVIPPNIRGVMYIILAILVLILIPALAGRTIGPHISSNRTVFDRSSAMKDATIYKYSDHFATRLLLSKENRLFSQCGHAPVLWLGSSSNLINCKGQLILTQNVQDFPMLRRDFAFPLDLEGRR